MTIDHGAVARRERARLEGLAYRLTGAWTEAQDIVQEALLRLTRQDDVEVPAAWLTTVVTRLSIDHLRSARAQREQYVGPWLPEPLPGAAMTTADDPETQALLAASVSSALLVLLESLSPAERAAFVLHDVFGHGHDEVATMLERSPAAVRKLASRARAHLRTGRGRYAINDHVRARVAAAFRTAATTGDLDGLMALLSPDVTFVADGGGVVAAVRRPVEGREAVVRVLSALRSAGTGTRLHATELNGAPGLLVTGSDGAIVTAVTVAIGADGDVHQVFAVRHPAKLAHLPTPGPDSGVVL